MHPANQNGAGTRHGGRDHRGLIAFVKREIERRSRTSFFGYRRDGLLRSLAFGANSHSRCIARLFVIAVHFDRINELWRLD